MHIASHGEFGGGPADNFLLAYDGRVSMDQLAAMVGATRFRAEQPLELLTLSACESAAGDDRAALGLAGVALRAGARSALATLWSVNDQATAEFVVAFAARPARLDQAVGSDVSRGSHRRIVCAGPASRSCRCWLVLWG